MALSRSRSHLLSTSSSTDRLRCGNNWASMSRAVWEILGLAAELFVDGEVRSDSISPADSPSIEWWEEEVDEVALMSRGSDDTCLGSVTDIP